MAPPSDSPNDPETGRVVDPEVLAGRRARRAERDEEGLLERAQRAERMVVALEHRLDEAEGRLAIAKRDRGKLAGDLERVERDLTAALQREFAEQRLRVELEGDSGSARAELEGEAEELRAAHRAAQSRAAELEQELAAVRSEVDDARERAAADRQAVAVVESRQGLQDELGRLQAFAEELHASLLAERTAREEAELALAAEGERTAAEAARLRAELERRTALHEALGAQVTELRSGFESIRIRTQEEGRARALAETTELREALEHRTRLEGEARASLEAMRGELAGLRAELAAAREEGAGQAEREAAVELLVAELVATTQELRQAFEAHVEALGHDHAEELAGQREASAAELAREAAGRLEAEEALAALLAELESRGGENPVYGVLSAGLFSSTADHPALRRPEPDADAPATPVVSDLARAAARLRAQAAGPLPAAPEEEEVADAVEPSADEAAYAEQLSVYERELAAYEEELAAYERSLAEPEGAIPSHDEGTDTAPAPVVAFEEAAPVAYDEDEDLGEGRRTVAERLPAPPSLQAEPLAAVPAAATREPWFAAGLVTLAAVDAASAERLLLAAFRTQAALVDKAVTYEVELPATGRHQVRVERRGEVAVTQAEHDAGDAEFRLEGGVEALAPLLAGSASRKLRGAAIRGRKRRYRRLARALSVPVGLPELQAAGAPARAGDLLALLCLAVPAEAVRGADFGVAYVVTGPGGEERRTLVRAEADGSLTAIPEAPEQFAADATVRVDAGALPGLLAAPAAAPAEGDAGAVATLHGWFRGVQGLPA